MVIGTEVSEKAKRVKRQSTTLYFLFCYQTAFICGSWNISSIMILVWETFPLNTLVILDHPWSTASSPVKRMFSGKLISDSQISHISKVSSHTFLLLILVHNLFFSVPSLLCTATTHLLGSYPETSCWGVWLLWLCISNSWTMVGGSLSTSNDSDTIYNENYNYHHYHQPL